MLSHLIPGFSSPQLMRVSQDESAEKTGGLDCAEAAHWLHRSSKPPLGNNRFSQLLFPLSSSRLVEAAEQVMLRSRAISSPC
jgi:hypothetical protein